MKEILLKTEHLQKSYGNVTPLADVNLTVSPGEAISVIGPSGTGKSTLLRMLNRLEEPTAGKICLLRKDAQGQPGAYEDITAPGCDLGRVRQSIGMIFQSFNLFPHLTVVENIMAAPVALRHLSRQEAYDRARELLAGVGLAAKAFSYPDELSGGQQQRVAIVRALAMEPEILLLDEPTSALDPAMTGEVEAVIRKVAASGATLLMVTHSMELARRVSSRILYLDQGGIYEEGTPEELFTRPQKDRTRQFIERLKVLTIAVDSPDFDFYGSNAAIEDFCRKNDISRSAAYALSLLFEELCLQLLPAHLPELSVKWTAEYSEEKQESMVRVEYGGSPFDIRQSKDKLSLKVIEGLWEIVSVEYREGERLGNRVLLRTKKGKTVS